jgi:acetylglutamate kinase
MENVLVIKIGGNVIDDEKALDAFLDKLAGIKGHKILVHGGGKLATELSTQLGITTNMVNGRRITDKPTVKVVTMVYAGWVNKSIVAALQSKGCSAIGLSGADAALIPAIKRPVSDIDYGWVGDIVAPRVNIQLLQTLLQAGYSVVVAPITCNAHGDLLNINADTVASALATAVSQAYNTTLIYCFEKNGLLRDVNDNTSAMPEIKAHEVEELKNKGIISKGMLPKIDNAIDAVNKGVSSVIIGHADDISLLATKQKGYGTHISS